MLIISPEKTCSRCSRSRPSEAFRKRKGRTLTICRECESAETRTRYALKQASSTRLAVTPDKRRCSRCFWPKPLAEFRRDKDSVCLPCERVRLAERYQAKKAEEKARMDRWRAENPEKMLAYNAVYRGRHRRRVRAQKAVSGAKRRAQKAGGGGVHTTPEFEAKLARYGGRCHWCRKRIKGTPHRDHLIPLARGGSNDISNVVPSCATCNTRKNAKMPWEFMGRLL